MGPESKIMMNAKKPPTKISNVQRKMNQMLYSVSQSLFTHLGFRLSAHFDSIICHVEHLLGPEDGISSFISKSHFKSRFHYFHHIVPHILGSLLSSDPYISLCRSRNDQAWAGKPNWERCADL